MPILKCLVPIIYCKSLELHIIANKSFIAVLYCLALYQFDNAMVSYFLFSQWFVDELTGSPINIILLLIIGFLIYKLLKPESGKYYYLCQPIEKLSKPIKYYESDLFSKKDLHLISDAGSSLDIEPPLAPMKKKDYTPRQLKPYDGTKSDQNPEGRILIGVLGKVYDMTKGKGFYGPGRNHIIT